MEACCLFFSGTVSLFCWLYWLNKMSEKTGYKSLDVFLFFLLNLGCSNGSWSQKYVDIMETFLFSALNTTLVACVGISECHLPTLLGVWVLQWFHLGMFASIISPVFLSEGKRKTFVGCCHGFDLKSLVRPCGVWLLFTTKWEQARLECRSSHTKD